MVKVKHTPERTCVACGQKLPKRELLRIVRTPLGAVHVDPTGKAAGRGAYLCGSAACWQRAIHKGGLERGLHAQVCAPDREQLMAYFQQYVQQHAAGPSAAEE
ncbi:MAG: YlxR family protein [SAR202 cluster bacterium]|nr:YlxR family protein [SAR202 cluster bacterium]